MPISPSSISRAAPAHPPIWTVRGAMPSQNPGAMLGFWSMLILLGLLPFYGLAMVVITVVELMKDLPLSYASTLTDPLIWVPVVISALILPLLLAYFSSRPTVLGFSFDAARQVLSYTEVRPYRAPREVEVPFDAIVSVAPYKMTNYETSGHFQVTVPDSGARRKPRTHTLRFGMRIPLTEMQAHADWLRPYLGKRMEDLHEME